MNGMDLVRNDESEALRVRLFMKAEQSNNNHLLPSLAALFDIETQCLLNIAYDQIINADHLTLTISVV